MNEVKIKKSFSLSKNFFNKSRPNISNTEALKDVIPIKWDTKNIKGNDKVIAYSIKERDKLK